MKIDEGRLAAECTRLRHDDVLNLILEEFHREAMEELLTTDPNDAIKVLQCQERAKIRQEILDRLDGKVEAAKAQAAGIALS